MDIQEMLNILTAEFTKASMSRFTGQVTISINMNQGGIGQVSLQTVQNLQNFKKTKT